MYHTMCIARGELGLLGKLSLATRFSGRLLIIPSQITQKPEMKSYE